MSIAQTGQYLANICPRTTFTFIKAIHLWVNDLVYIYIYIYVLYSYNMNSRANSKAGWGPDAVWDCPTGSGPRHSYCLQLHNFAEAAEKKVNNIYASSY